MSFTFKTPIKHKNIAGSESELLNLYINEEYSVQELCRKYNVQSKTIRDWLKKNDIHIRSPKESRNIPRRYDSQRESLKYKFSLDEIEDILGLYSQGYGARFISKKYKKSPDMIFRILEENNVEIRHDVGLKTNKSKELAALTIAEKYGGWKNYRHWQFDKFEEKYGVRNAMQVEEFFYKVLNSKKKLKTVVVDGNIIIYQGYELLAIRKLLSEGYDISDICIGRGKVPSFKYVLNGKRKTYYPDIYIPKDNRIIEVKSLYTYTAELDKNLAKRDSVIAQNYRFDFYIMEE